MWAKSGSRVATQRRVGFVASEQESAFARHDGAEGDPGGADGRLVGG